LGKGTRGFAFEEDTSSENLCRGGAAFSHPLRRGHRLEPADQFPPARFARAPRRERFETQGRVVHVGAELSDGERLVGVQFVDPRFQRVFRCESAAEALGELRHNALRTMGVVLTPKGNLRWSF
jgi:hypothetical protein